MPEGHAAGCVYRICRLSLLLTLVWISSQAKEHVDHGNDSSMPKSLTGFWQVNKTHIDLGSPRTRNMEYDDPRLTGRFLSIEYDKIRGFDGECVEPKIIYKKSPIGILLRTMGWRYVPPVAPTTRDYELLIPENLSLDVLWITCKTGGIGPVGSEIDPDHQYKKIGPDEANWMFVLSSGELAIRWFDDTILTLKKMPPTARPNPSFDCTKASSSSEKAICASIDLSSYDRSLSRMYLMDIQDLGKEGEDEALQWVRTTQKEWVAKRDKCGSDAECLKKSMVDRLEQLSHPIKTMNETQ